MSTPRIHVPFEQGIPQQPDEQGVSVADFPDDLKGGAGNFMLLLERVRKIGDATVLRFGEQFDGRDYRAIALEIESTIQANLLDSDGAIREGFLRAFADFLSTAADGALPGDGWNPERALKNTSIAYAPEGEAA